MNRAPDRIARAAPAKINLYLHVTGRRPDGYHLLDSLIAFAGVHDDVFVEWDDSLDLTIEGPFAVALAGDADNLVLRAARALAAAAGIEPRARIRLVKNLPVAAGIGGGSADAAATLGALAELWQLSADVPLRDIALSLGADVPMCVAGKASFAGGIGEVLAPTPLLPDCAMLLVSPGTPLSTPSVFAARSGPFSEACRFGAAPDTAAALAEILAQRRNDLEAPARELEPAVRTAISALSAESGCLLARMSGSGATCFGLFADQDGCEAAARRIAAEHPNWWIAPTRLITDVKSLEIGAQ